MISSGDILRQQVNDNTALGKEAAQIMKEGGLVPDLTMQELVHGEFDRSRHLAVMFTSAVVSPVLIDSAGSDIRWLPSHCRASSRYASQQGRLFLVLTKRQQH